jgi:hypothetical protein
MSDTAPRKRKMRSFTVAALLGIFVAAVVLAVGGRLLPGPLSRLMSKRGGDRS